MTVIGHALAWDTTTPAPILTALAAHVRRPTQLLALHLISHPNTPADTTVDVSETLYIWLPSALHRPGVTPDSIARAAKGLPTSALVAYNHNNNTGAAPAVLDELAIRGATCTEEAHASYAIATSATHRCASRHTQLAALRLAAASPPGRFRTDARERLVTAATRFPQDLAELAAAATAAGNEMAGPLTDLNVAHAHGRDPHSLRLRTLHERAANARSGPTQRSERDVDQEWARTLGATDDPAFVAHANALRGRRRGDLDAVLANALLATTPAYWRAYAEVSSRTSYPDVTTSREATLARARHSDAGTDLLFSATTLAQLDGRDLGELWAAYERVEAENPTGPYGADFTAQWALHPQATPAQRAAFTSHASEHVERTANTHAPVLKAWLRALIVLVDAVDAGTVADVPLPYLADTLAEPGLERFVSQHIAAALRPHHATLRDPHVLTAALALEDGFAGTLNDLLTTIAVLTA